MSVVWPVDNADIMAARGQWAGAGRAVFADTYKCSAGNLHRVQTQPTQITSHQTVVLGPVTLHAAYFYCRPEYGGIKDSSLEIPNPLSTNFI